MHRFGNLIFLKPCIPLYAIVKYRKVYFRGYGDRILLKRKDIRVRDPFILLDHNCYYMYVSASATSLSYYMSSDLENWEFGGIAFEIPDNFWAYKDVWAAEVHRYNDKFYLFVSLLGKNGLRGTQIAVSDTPKGPFVPVAECAATPKEQSCIDGTLYVQNGTPYIIYSHDWPDNYIAEENAYVGEICAAQLSDDLTETVGEPWVLFASNQSPISKATPHHIVYNNKSSIRYGSDAPFVQQLSNGALFLTWSPYLNDNYVVLSVISANGNLKGPWRHCPVPLYDKNGGHAMFFNTIDGKHCMCLHAPEHAPDERARIFEVGEEGGTLSVIKEIGI